ncbi:MAG: ATP-binding protein [Synergistaceae bacterium]|nr:ATP-binding protein [Synergistaceae bacterium]
MKYIVRDLEKKIVELSRDYSCLLLSGARQVGKTTVLKQLADANRSYVTLDDIEERRLAQTDPALFLRLHGTPLLIDEAQYAPQLFPYIKIEIDKGAQPGAFWLTGSQNFKMTELAQESLAGRIALLQMPPLSAHEIYGSGEILPFSPAPEALTKRRGTGKAADAREIYERIWQGSMPGYVSGKFKDRDVFYSGYLQTYLERDITNVLKLSDSFQFRDFIRAAACRTGQLLNLHDMASDVGISADTAKRWLFLLEKSDVVFLLRPYSNNLLKRTVKTPKLYFFDTGLAAWLTKYETAEILMNGAINGAILENYAVSEIVKSFRNSAKECLLWYYRDKDGKEIDLVLETNGRLHPLEIKKSASPSPEIVKTFRLLDKAETPRGSGAVLCLKEELSALDADNYIVPIWML